MSITQFTSRLIFRVAVLLGLCCTPALADTLAWSTGDPINTITVGLVNGVFTSGQANIYDTFIVPAGGWQVTSVFSYDEMLPSTAVTQANWQIRSGLSSGNGGTLVASGTSAATQTLLFSGSGYVIDKIEVDGLSTFLGAGQYWLSVAPVTSNGDVPSIVPTSDVNAVGLPAEHNNGTLTFDNYPALGFNYFANPTSAGSAHDWAMGLDIAAASATPEPSTLSFLFLGLIIPAFCSIRRRMAKA